MTSILLYILVTYIKFLKYTLLLIPQQRSTKLYLSKKRQFIILFLIQLYTFWLSWTNQILISQLSFHLNLKKSFSDYESPQPKLEMVASLQSRKDSLEAKLKEKNEELKALCIQEAELTGVLPPETPLEAGESPPMLRRRVGTVFTYPENLINKLKSKEVRNF